MTSQKILRFAFGFLLVMHARGESSSCKIRLIASASGPPQIEVSYLGDKGKPVKESMAAIVVPRGTPLYHWTDDKRAYKGWVSAGRVPEATMDAINANWRAVGGGVYVSTSIWDSHGYGSHLVMLEAPQDLILLPFELRDRLEKCSDLLYSKSLIDAGFDGAHDQPTTWMALVSNRATAKVKGLGDTGTVLSAMHDLTLCELARLDARMRLVPNDALAHYYPTLYKVLSGRPLRLKEKKAMLREIQESLKTTSNSGWLNAGETPRSKLLHCSEMDESSFLKKLKRRVENSKVQDDIEEPVIQDSETKHAL